MMRKSSRARQLESKLEEAEKVNIILMADIEQQRTVKRRMELKIGIQLKLRFPLTYHKMSLKKYEKSF